MIFMSACGRGLTRQSSILKKSPLKSDCPLAQSSRNTWTYSARYSYRRQKYSSPGHRPICEYSGRCHPVMTLSPKRPLLIESIVEAIRATMAGGMSKVGEVANNLIFDVTAASPAIRVKDSRL